MIKDKSGIKKEPISIDCILVCLYFICLPFTNITTPYGSVLKLVAMPVAAILAIRILLNKKQFTFNYIHAIYILYILYTVMLLAVYSEERAVTTTKDMVFGMLMLILISMEIYNDNEKEWIESSWMIVGIICIIVAITSKEYLSNSEHRAVIKIFGYEEDQNHFCAYFIMPILISMKRFQEKKRFYPLYIAIIILSFYAVLKTGSRGGLIGIMAGMFVYILFGIKSIRSRIVVVLAAALVGITVFTVVVPNLPDDVRERYSVEAVKEDGATGRFDIWAYLLDYTARYPERLMRGSGIFSTYKILGSAGFRNGVAHNTYIQVLCDEGVIGLFLFLALMAACMIRAFKSQSLYTCAFISLLVFSMSLTFYVFKPALNIMIMCAMTFEKTLPENNFKALQRGEEDDV